MSKSTIHKWVNNGIMNEEFTNRFMNEKWIHSMI